MRYSFSQLKLLLVATGFFVSLPFSTSIASPIYGEIGYLGTIFKQSGLRAHVGLVKATVGYQINNYFSLEAYYGTKTKSKTVYVGTTAFKVSAKDFFGGYVKAQKEVDTNLTVYAKAGFSSVAMQFKSDSGTQQSREGSFSYAVGVEYAITEKFYLMAGYEDFYHRPRSSISGWVLGIGYHF